MVYKHPVSTQAHIEVSKSAAAVFAVILLIAAIGLLYHLGKPPLIPFDDASYADVSKNIVTSGDWLHFRWFGGIPFLEKPPLYFWITAALFRLFGIGEYSARLFPVLCGIGLLACVYFLAGEFAHGEDKVADHSQAVFAPLILLTLSDFWEYSSRAVLDIPVTLFVTLALGCFWIAQRKSSSVWYLLYGAAVASAILIKSAVGLIPIFVTVLFFLATNPKRLLDRRYLFGTALAFVLSLPWHVFMYLSYGRIFLQEYIGYHIIQRFSGNIVAHQGPPSFYLAYLWQQAPVFVFALLAIAPLVIYGIIRSRDQIFIFLAIWSLFVLVLFSLSNTKIPWYILPFYPPAAALIGYAVGRFAQRAWFFRAAITVVLLFSAVRTGYRFHRLRVQQADETYLFTQYATIAKELKIAARPQEKIYVFGAGEPLPLINFYADRPAHLLFNDAGTLETLKQIPTNYIGEGVAQFIPDT